MRKSTIWLLGAVMLFAFFGLLYLQANYIHAIISNQEDQFEEAVKRSLYQVSNDIELEETAKFLDDQIIASNKRYLGKKSTRSSSRIMQGEQQRLSLGGNKSTLSEKKDLSLQSQAIQESWQERYLYNQNLLDQVIRNLMKASDKPIEERLDFDKLNNYIKTELQNNNLELPFTFVLVDNNKNIIFGNEDINSCHGKRIYSQVLFPKSSDNKVYTLKVVFPTERKYVLNSVSFIVPSLVFTVVLLLIFISTLYVIFRQKRLSEMKNDFVNNMTHELKTPVASISLAAQTLNDPGLKNSPRLMESARAVIGDESKRLGFLVEKVLQMSLFEDGATQFKMVDVDVNDLIASIANTFVLRVEKAGGTLDIELEALESTIMIDKMHFTNVLFNLMENAIKYRNPNKSLELIIKTANVGDRVQITIQDNGIGIKKENIKKIFDRFYRVPTGNRHDVKGFGLGLAYVKRIVNELNGTIKAESDYGEFTRFIISLPSVKI
ncbi:HAMP domain-containing histidine kinase [Bacteroidales bacterium OttesenSCG-928-M11]|nr:HAMP domain-containing histidine kinase [Bacteroidales bacterium OttesenSCG-928-M11]